VAPHFAACVARFRNPGGEVCGAGFLIDSRHVMTCAHVINAALGRSLESQERPDGALRLELPGAGVEKMKAEAVEWHAPVPYGARDAGKPSDIAVLRLKAETSAPAARLAKGRAEWGREFRTFGFPVENGEPADGETTDEDFGGWIHFRQTKDYGHLIKRGFSGAPAFAADDNTVIGMIVAVQEGDESRVAYGEPLGRLQMAWPLMATPYKGLARFDRADADFFFGRESIVQELLGRVERDPVTLIVGASGGGKSSLVFGGLIPKLDNGAWRVASFRPGEEPVKNLAWALAELMVQGRDPDGLWGRAEEMRCKLSKAPEAVFDAADAMRRTLGTRLLIVTDQFEELFTLCRDEKERAAFIGITSQIAARRAAAPVSLIATLRADFMGEVLRVAALGELLDGHYLMLRAMNGDELGRAIREPARRLGVEFEEGVDDLILATVAKDAAALPLMEFALERLWDEQEGRRLTRAAHERMGGLEGSLARHADEIVDQMSEPEQARVRQLLCRLVNVARPGEGEDTKRRQSRQEVGEELWSVAQRLSGQAESGSAQRPARLLVLYRDEQQREAADIIHEALIRRWPRLQGWLGEERSYLLLVEELQNSRRRWEDGKLADRLLRGRDLERALESRGRLLEDYPELRDFIEASDENAQEERAIEKADAIWEPIEFQDGNLSPREMAALRELAKADDRVRRVFLRRLSGIPVRAQRFCRLPQPIVRAALGLRADRAELVWDSVDRTRAVDGPPEITAALLLLLACSGVDDQRADEVLEAAFSRQRMGGDVGRGIAAWASAFASQLGEERAGRALDRVLDVIGQTTDPHQLQALGRAAQALASRLDPGRAGRVLDRVLDVIGQTTQTDQLQALGPAAQALASRFDLGRAGRVLDRVLNVIGQTTDPDQLQALGQVAQALTTAGARPDAERASRALDRLLDAIGQTTSSYQLRALGPATQALTTAGARPDAERASRALDRVLNAIGQTTKPNQLQALGQVAQALTTAGARPDPDRTGRPLDRVLNAIGQTTNPNQLQVLGQVAQALVSCLAPERGDPTLVRVLDVIGQTTNPNQLQVLGQAAQALASRLDLGRASRALDRVLNAIGQTTDPNQLRALGQAAQALTSAGAWPDPGHARTALERVLDAIGQTADGYQLQALGQAAQALTSAGARPDPERAGRALDRALDVIGQTTNPNELQALGQAAQALASRLDLGRVGRALDRVLNAIGQTTDSFRLEALGRATQALASAGARPDPERTRSALERVLDAIGQSTSSYQLKALGQAARALIALVALPELAVPAIVNTLKLPNAAFEGVEDGLIAGLRTLHPEMPAPEEGFWAAIEWLRGQYPNVDFDDPPR